MKLLFGWRAPGERVIRDSLGQLNLLAEGHRAPSPAMLIIGEVAQLGQYNE
jgi:siroheme synthase